MHDLNVRMLQAQRRAAVNAHSDGGNGQVSAGEAVKAVHRSASAGPKKRRRAHRET
ncbi:hypothetical protein GCM10022224_095260 [Nonomuraea antimicrobica]|uniref:Uncharacterized protein n=1 Tax=Nonomuraea antimicrobica TaxID=561173 RepID=A0ABP7E7I6_9ACTN